MQMSIAPLARARFAAAAAAAAAGAARTGPAIKAEVSTGWAQPVARRLEWPAARSLRPASGGGGQKVGSGLKQRVLAAPRGRPLERAARQHRRHGSNFQTPCPTISRASRALLAPALSALQPGFR